jgi:hypothetical protein
MSGEAEHDRPPESPRHIEDVRRIPSKGASNARRIGLFAGALALGLGLLLAWSVACDSGYGDTIEKSARLSSPMFGCQMW